jgi:AmiR/NasT family two-component response regulator
MTIQQPHSVLIAEDEALVGNVIQHLLEKIGYKVTGRAMNGRQAVEMAQTLQPEVILMDIIMPEIDGLEASRLIQEKCPKPIVLLSAYDDVSLVSHAGQVGAGAYLVKPPEAQQLRRAITIASARFADMMELRRLNHELQEALNQVKVLSGFLPICASCKKIRDDRGFWQQLEQYIAEHSDAVFSHGICPACAKNLYPGLRTLPST